MDPPEFACDFSITSGIEEIAENRVRARVHVEVFAVPLQKLKFPDRVLLGHGLFDLRFGCD